MNTLTLFNKVYNQKVEGEISYLSSGSKQRAVETCFCTIAKLRWFSV